ncbi:MAG: hypothetical protein NNA20_07890 [Nitrospira sp.]|nr:hypothetical protein [Nitrospira sp.]
MYVLLLLLLLSAMAAGVPDGACAAESRFSKAPNDAQTVPTTITSNKMTVLNRENQAIFEGNVVLTRGGLVVNSEKMIVFFQGPAGDAARPPSEETPKKFDTMASPSGRSIERVEAIGHVKIRQENSHATCQKAVYFGTEEKIVMTGDPVAWEKGTRVSGHQITIYLAEERSVVEGGSHVRIIEEAERLKP